MLLEYFAQRLIELFRRRKAEVELKDREALALAVGELFVDRRVGCRRSSAAFLADLDHLDRVVRIEAVVAAVARAECILDGGCDCFTEDVLQGGD